MDIQVSSNFERVLFDAYGRDGAAVQQLMNELADNNGFDISQGARQFLQEQFQSGRASEKETLATIRAIHAETGQVLCPHTAVGAKVAREHIQGATPMITLATAHPAKFPAAVEDATGIKPPLPNRMSDLYERSERVTRVANDLSAIEAVINERRRD